MYNYEQVWKVFLGRIAAKTNLKMDYFDSKSQKIAPCLRRLGLRPQTPVQVKWLENM